MKILKNISLKPYNTFGIDVLAKNFVKVNTIKELKEILNQYPDCFILGGGSNMLLTKNIDNCVVKLDLKGVSEKPLSDNDVLVTAQAGENWHDFVLWCLSKNYGGLENLSLIPGSVGACPIQNIGAYGVEVKDTITQVEALEIASQKIVIFSNDDCQFSYRNSIFKSVVKGKYIITSVTFKLTRQNHTLHTQYGAIKSELEGISNPTIKDVSNAVIKIRFSKLPNPNEIGNSGSFFKNPIVNSPLFEDLLAKNSEMPFYKMNADNYKIPAGWLIEQCGFKGKHFGDAGVHNKQALVLVNYGDARGQDILNLSEMIKKSVKNTFKINLETEVNIVS
ncbi:MAG: UDP-N-acetylmuramate dehydrogenase [Flavobacteriaceae bacterium]